MQFQGEATTLSAVAQAKEEQRLVAEAAPFRAKKVCVLGDKRVAQKVVVRGVS